MEETNNVQRLAARRNNMYWIVYQTTNLVNNKIYIGVHQTKNPDIFDGYLGNGIYVNQPSSYIYRKTKFECAVHKYGPNKFKRTTLNIFDNEEDAYAEEARLVNEEFLARPDVYNMILGGKLPNMLPPIKTVYQYDLNGNFIKEFESLKLAGSIVHRNPSSISDACINNYTCAGFYWSLNKMPKLDLQNYHTLKNLKTLYQYSITGEYLQEFPSTRSTGYSQASQSAILGNLVDKKYYFCYIKAENYSKARDIYVKSRCIYQYDASGKFISEWNYLEALKEFPNDSINQAIRHKTLTKSGFFWGLQKYNTYNQPVKKAQRVIGQYDLKGNLIRTFKNSSECYKEVGKNAYKNLVGIRKSYKGYIYKYIE